MEDVSDSVDVRHARPLVVRDDLSGVLVQRHANLVETNLLLASQNAAYNTTEERERES